MNASKSEQNLQLFPAKITRIGNDIKLSAKLISPGHTKELCYTFPEKYRDYLSGTSDPFVIAAIFLAMETGLDLKVHGSVSRLLIENLDEFQQVWTSWKPKRYKKISIIPESPADPVLPREEKVIMTFSGGLDSCYSAWKHTISGHPFPRRKPEAAILVHGFDIPLGNEQAFKNSALKAGKILNSIDIKLIPLKFNFRLIIDNWEDTHAAALASSLQLFSGRYSAGLIASSHAYSSLRFPWGSNPVTDPMLSGSQMKIINDGGESARWQKAAAISDWKEATQNLRICYKGKEKDRNCGACNDCITTAFYFAATGKGSPECLNTGSIKKALNTLYTLPVKPVGVQRIEEFIDYAKKTGFREKWLAELEKCKNFHKKRLALGKRTGAIMLLIQKLICFIKQKQKIE